MAQLIELPHVGESVVEGTIGKWLKQPGDRVERYDPLVEVVTDKVTMEVPSPVAGELLRIIAQEGETIPMGAPIAEVDTGDSAPAAAPATDTVATAPSPAAASTPMPAEPAPAVPVAYLIDAQPVGPTGGSALEARAETAIDTAAPSAAVVSERDSGASVVQPDVSKPPNRLSPAVRRLAREHNIDVSRIAGTGIGGRVTRNDVLRYLEAAPASAPAASVPAQPSTTSDEERLPLTPVRRMIAEAMMRSVREIPHAWSMVEVDINDLVSLRNRERDRFRSQEGVNLTYLPFALKAVAGALKENPTLNASWGDDYISLKRRINLGIAVAAPNGLVVPVIHDADRLSIAGLAHAVADLSQRARAGSLRLEDVQGGTFTVNNTGALGSVLGGPIINHPQAGILTTEAVQQRPVVINDAIAIRWMMNLCLSFDHRINDGAEAGAFLQSVKRLLEAFDGDTAIY
ncbi:MAG: 2-oxo acid dehydrogenase subunit E2 [Chloroflexi bacterium]|nr:2-oxo acid dehydrogenase subunit E2 [Chloroflexota bacterium]MYD48705.1 2-oxo acid dehydrogenase subunit E2 [Chloroflexota bacterium]